MSHIRLRDVFYYITLSCNLRCQHCYVGENLAPHAHADFESILASLCRCHEEGAQKVIFLGGEPTLHPDYDQILAAAAKIGYVRIIVDTNGVARYPATDNPSVLDRLTIRFGFDGAVPETHDAIRGVGTFATSLHTLRRVVAQGIRTEVTFTLNAINVLEVSQMINRFTDEGISEINFHFISLIGNAWQHRFLELTPQAIVRAQEQLQVLKQHSAIPLRYPKLLVRKEELEGEMKRGFGCHMFKTERVLIFPRGEMCRCPLKITSSLGCQAKLEEATCLSGCPLSWRVLPSGIPDDYIMTCISWKDH